MFGALPDQAEAHDLAMRIHADIATPRPPVEAQREAAAWLFRRERFAAAVHAFERARALEPGNVVTLSNLGLALLRAARPQDAEAVLAHALAMDPQHTGARQNHGTVLRALGRLTQAEAAYRAVLASEPNHVAAWNNLGLLLKEMNRLPESEQACRRALALDDRHAEIHNNLGNALWQMGEIEASVEAYRRALARRPDYAAARTNLALPLLTLGDYANAWPLYEWRHDASMGAEAVARPPVPYPQWQGEPLAGKSVLVWPEQGLGDALQFVRYVPMLKALGAAHVSLACAPTLARLFETLDGVDRVIPLDGEGRIERHDYWILTMSLPMRFGTTVATIPARVPYLHAREAEAARWREHLPHDRLNVGLVWAGNPRADQAASYAIDQRRSLDAPAFLPLLHTPGVRFVSLQLGETTRPQIAALPAELRPFDPMGEVRDFADTAAIVANLDLVITVDTSMAHLAGALGTPVWVLSRYAACWRWFKDREDSPWYPHTRVFRQTRRDAWDDTLANVEQALRALAASASAKN